MSVISYSDLISGSLTHSLSNVSGTIFEEMKTSRRYAQIELKSAVNAVSNLRNYTTVTDGSVTVASTGEYKVSTDAVLGGTALFQSGQRGRYLAGYQAEWGIGVRVPTQTWAGTQKVEWGYFDTNNGMGFGIDASGYYIFIKRDGTTTKTYQADWNLDTLDGSKDENNPSGYTVNFNDGLITQVEFAWYGYGPVVFEIAMKDVTKRMGSDLIRVHSFNPTQQTSIQQPNLPLSVEISNGNQSTARDIYIGGRQFSVYGEPNEQFRITGERRTAVALVNSAWRPVISFRRKSGIGNNQSVELAGVNIVPDGNILFTFVTGGTLTGESWGALTDVAATETILEADIAATAITGGTFFGGEYCAVGSNKADALGVLDNLSYDFVNSNAVTLVARSIAASATITMATLNAKERW